MEDNGTRTRWDDETRRLADELLEKVTAEGGTVKCNIAFPDYCIEIDEMTVSTITELSVEDGTLQVTCEEYIERRTDPITEYRPWAVKTIHQTIVR